MEELKNKYKDVRLAYRHKVHAVRRFGRRIDNSKFMKEIRRPVAEFYGTWALTMVACMVNVMYALSQRIVQLQVGFAIGLVLSALIYSASQISGAHFNPVVSWAFFLRGVFPFPRLILYWIAQFSGGMIAGGMTYAVFNDTGFIGANFPNEISEAEAFYYEAVFTFLFIMTIINVANRSQIVGANAAIAIGFALCVCHFCTIQVTGTGINPARSLGPAVWVGGYPLHVVWIYFAGPFVGSTAAVILTTFFNIIPPKSTEGAAKGAGKSKESEGQDEGESSGQGRGGGASGDGNGGGEGDEDNEDSDTDDYEDSDAEQDGDEDDPGTPLTETINSTTNLTRNLEH